MIRGKSFEANHDLIEGHLYTATAAVARKLQTGYRPNRRSERNPQKGDVEEHLAKHTAAVESLGHFFLQTVGQPLFQLIL